jgi:hypothetical protein
MNNTSKTLGYGVAFGAVFGLIEILTVSMGWSVLYFFTGTLSFIAYCLILVFIVRSEAKAGKNYKKRFLSGFIFSLAIGLVYGIFAGLSGYIFAEQIAQTIQEGVGTLGQFGLSNDIISKIDNSPTPVSNLLSEFFGAIFFNLIFGGIFSLIVAAIFKADDKKVINANAEETKQAVATPTPTVSTEVEVTKE